jgi:hypothetical protein
MAECYVPKGCGAHQDHPHECVSSPKPEMASCLLINGCNCDLAPALPRAAPSRVSYKARTATVVDAKAQSHLVGHMTALGMRHVVGDVQISDP